MAAFLGCARGAVWQEGLPLAEFPLQLHFVLDASIDRGTVEEVLERTGLAKPQRPGV